jgi:DNA-binding beta-propeller fold protein YncE
MPTSNRLARWLHRLLLPLGALGALAGPVAAQSTPVPNYHVVRTHGLGGEGGWDYLALDTVGGRLFIARTSRVMVVDPASGKLLGEVPGLVGAHGVAFDQAHGRGFATSGNDGSVTMFDLKTLKILGKIPAADDADAILFDPASGRVFTFNGDAHSATVIDPAAGKRVATLALGAKPEFGVSAGDGKVYVNLESTSQIAEIDARNLKVLRKWSIAPCEGPSGLAIDRAHHRLFSVCDKVMAVSDAQAGKVVATVAIGDGPDAARFDPATGNAFSSNGRDGTVTVVHEDAPNRYHVVQTVQTMRGSRTMELNPRTHQLYLAGAKFGAAADGARRPPMVPGSFSVMVLDPK